MPRAILLDIEGTTTPISFVYDVLFPFAREHAKAYLLQADLQPLQAAHTADIAQGLQPPPWSDGPIHYLYWLMDQDRKSTALKSLQGKIWQQGYEAGELHGEVFPDVPPALQQWQAEGIDVRIYSSGSILAQKLLFSTTLDGDLTRFINGYFDTGMGGKTEPASYLAITSSFNLPPTEILFISDVAAELAAAAQIGMQTRLCERPGNRPQPPHSYRVITSFAELQRLG